MKRSSIFFVILFLTLISPVNALCDENRELRLILEELKKITQELRDIKTIFKNPRGRQGPSKAEISIDDDPMLGKRSAKVTVVEFSDYQCPYCKSFFTNTFPRIKKEYIDTGKVRYVLRDFPLPMHRYAKKAAEAANCAKDQNNYWEMHDMLFKNQKNLKPDDLKRYAASLGLEMNIFNKCLSANKYADEVKKDFLDAANIGLSGTPSFIVGKTGKTKKIKGKVLRGAVPYAQFRGAIEPLLKGK